MKNEVQPHDDGQAGHRQQEFLAAVAKSDFNFESVKIHDPKPTGRQILETGGFRPVDEHILMQLLETGAIEELRLDETVELHRKDVPRFIVFHSDRSFRVSIDDRRFQWGSSDLTGLIAKQMAGKAPASTGIWLERRDEPDLFVRDDDVIMLDTEGLERLRTGPVFLLWIEGKEFQWPRPRITTQEIAELGGWDPAQGVQQIDLATNEARTLKTDAEVNLDEINTFAKRIGWRRG